MSASNKALLSAISQDRALGSSVLFGHRHGDSSPPFHVAMLDLWASADELVMIEAFRQGAKSTLAEEHLLMEAAFGNFRYAVVFAENYAKACQRIEAIAYEAKHNIKVRTLFGGDVLSKKPIENKIHFKSGCLIEGVGWEQEITGFKYLDFRPDRAYLDDVENLERVRDAEAVDKTMDKIYRELLPAMDKNRRKIRVTQTPRAIDSMVTRIRQDPGWITMAVPICDGDIDDPRTKSNWPSRYPMEWIRQERDTFARQGKLRLFMQEYMLSVDDSSSKPFTDDMIRGVDIVPDWLPKYLIYDPARTANIEQSDRTGKVCVSRMGSKIIVHESKGAYWKPDEMRRDIFEADEKHRPAKIVIEKNSLDEYLMQPIRTEMLQKGVALPIVPVSAPQDRDKETFIMGLQPFFAAGEILLVGGRSAHPELISETLNFPGGKLDVLNALAYSTRIFAGVPVYDDFSDQVIAPAPEPKAIEQVYAAWNSDASNTVCVAVLRQGRHLFVLADWAGSGSVQDAARNISLELKAAYPKNPIAAWVPAVHHDQQDRVALVPALRTLKLMPYRSEHPANARGGLAERMRTVIRNRRLLTVDKRARHVLAGLAGDYRFGVDKAGRSTPTPEAGISKLCVETLECLSRVLDSGVGEDVPKGLSSAQNASGRSYFTAAPGMRGR